jgi:hypothetical protein
VYITVLFQDLDLMFFLQCIEHSATFPVFTVKIVLGGISHFKSFEDWFHPVLMIIAR